MIAVGRRLPREGERAVEHGYPDIVDVGGKRRDHDRPQWRSVGLGWRKNGDRRDRVTSVVMASVVVASVVVASVVVASVVVASVVVASVVVASVVVASVVVASVVVASVVVASVVVASVVVVSVGVESVESVASSQTYLARSKDVLADQPAAPSARNKSSSRV